jgi:type VI secretion system protein ImpH
MAAPDRPSEPAVADSLFTAGYRFDFFQAVRLLTRLYGVPASENTDTPLSRDAVRFTSRVALDFPASDVARVTPPAAPGEPAQMQVNLLGLAGSLGPLPLSWTEALLECVGRHDTAQRDFLDLFTHRLAELLYQVRQHHRIGLTDCIPAASPVARYLFALLGLGTEGLRGRLGVSDRALLWYTGLLACQPRSMAGLEILLSDYFQVPVRGASLCGRWYPLAADQTTRLGVTGQNQHLGQGVVLGTQVWEQDAAFALWLGPLTLQQFLDFLPTGRGFQPLCALTRFYVGQEFASMFYLTLPAAEVPASRLSASQGPRLGWTSWLKTREADTTEATVRLHPASGRWV